MKVKFVAPSSQAIDTAAQSICRELGKHNSCFLAPEVWQGLATYLKIVGAIHVRIMNAQNESDCAQNEKASVA